LKRAILILLLALAAALAFPQGALDEIKRRGELIIATDATYPPFEVKRDGQVVGFDVEVGAAIGRELGVKVRWLNMEWAGVLGSLESGKCDLVMAGVTITEERKQKGYLFSQPYFLSGQVIVRRKGDTRIGGPADLKKYKVAVQAETTGQFAAEKQGVAKASMNRFDQVQDGLIDVRNGKSDAFIGDLPTLKALLQESYSELEIIGGPFVKENLGIVGWKTKPELIAVTDRALETAFVDGTYEKAFEDWIKEPLTPQIVAGLYEVRNAGSPVKDVAPSSKPAAGTPVEAAAPRSSFTFRWDVLNQALPLLAKGALMTLTLTALAILFGIPLGLILALMRISPVTILRPFAMAYVEVVRGTPLLMQIYVIYFVLPAFGVQLDPFVSGVLALSLNAGAYISEIFRAGIESIDPGQMEAARSLGLDYRGAMQWVILPQTLRRVLPPLTNEAVALLKDSSLVSVVALSELMRVGKEIATDGGSPTTVYLTVALFYLAMTLPLTWLVRRLEAAWQPNGGGRRKRKAVTA